MKKKTANGYSTSRGACSEAFNTFTDLMTLASHPYGIDSMLGFVVVCVCVLFSSTLCPVFFHIYIHAEERTTALRVDTIIGSARDLERVGCILQRRTQFIEGSPSSILHLYTYNTIRNAIRIGRHARFHAHLL